MALITLNEASLAFGDEALLDKADFALEENERVCLVGRNGTGKSSLLKLLCGINTLDDGRMIVRQGLNIARLEQDPPDLKQGCAYNMVAMALGECGEHLNNVFNGTDTNGESAAYLEKHDMWYKDGVIRKVLNKLSIDVATPLESLSGGWMRKAALARALSLEPEVLLLDEPTNHLDIETIAFLEQYLKGFNGAIVFISHDRAFTDSLATRIVELDRGKLYSYPGRFDKYIELRDERLRKEELYRKEFDRVLAEEEAWIRRGVKARLARNEGRVRDLKQLREERAARRDRQGRVKMQVSEAEKSGNIVFELSGISVDYEGTRIIDNFAATVMRSDRIGIVGPNGAGKTTLIKVLLGQLKPDEGKVKVGSNVIYQYFDQYHETLELDKSVADNVAEGRQDITLGNKTLHVISYLKDFLFTARRALSPASVLSGGEKNRLMLARMFCRPCNVLILDEPTNDLDLETLELLEDLIASFKGTVIVISHDRRFIDKVATETWVFDGKGHIETIVGGWSDVLAYYRRVELENASKNTAVTKTSVKEGKEGKRAAPAVNDKKGLSFTQKHELEQLPDKIDELEQALSQLDEKIADPALYQDGSDKVKEVMQKRDELQSALDELYSKWEELSALE
ncbi:ATP-binding cassette domain-containing protein [Anaerobiospirillum thomasii]|uniref:ATP-binding protein Uup n=1 Tax=Anaerobiospirillum thomasii TaxID=179995 RepID=A0A2X0VR30_9GAMM|nr:ATP-binding cassette domain-containing protein [Anaerobiospirillum thomasii]SPT70210.1 Uncharacterized ABC transporter ATP-binding protein Rv2477c/MT2552 [Anaerobiospirillum thomasii]